MQAQSKAAETAAKLQGQMTLNQQKFNHAQALIDQENEARVVRDTFRELLRSTQTKPDVGLGNQ
jgi:hypothetical protein